jgi:tetratricopeptide (TPR) repeat protein
VHVLEGKLLGTERKFPEAARAFTTALTLDGTSIDAAIGLVTTDIGRGDHATAKQRAEALLAQRPKDPALRLLAARAYRSGNEPQRAEDLLKGLVQENPGNTAALGMLAEMYLSQGKLVPALERYEALSLREPKSVTVHTMIGMILQEQKKLPEAKKRYEQALEAGPNAAVAANNLAWLLADERQDLDRALTLANKAAMLRPKDPQVADTIGWVYYQKQLPTLALPSFEKAVGMNPENPEFHYHLGMALAATGETVKARTHLHKALALNPTFNGASGAKDLLATLKN